MVLVMHAMSVGFSLSCWGTLFVGVLLSLGPPWLGVLPIIVTNVHGAGGYAISVLLFIVPKVLLNFRTWWKNMVLSALFYGRACQK